MSATSRFVLAGLVGFLALGGCGSKTPLSEVQGVVKLDGKPIANVEVQFVPDYAQGTKGPRSTGCTDTNGRYQLTCDPERPGGQSRPGALAGHHRVVIVDVAAFAGKAPRRVADEEYIPPSRVPQPYQSAEGTPLRVEVKAGQKQTIDLDLRSQ